MEWENTAHMFIQQLPSSQQVGIKRVWRFICDTTFGQGSRGLTDPNETSLVPFISTTDKSDHRCPFSISWLVNRGTWNCPKKTTGNDFPDGIPVTGPSLFDQKDFVGIHGTSRIRFNGLLASYHSFISTKDKLRWYLVDMNLMNLWFFYEPMVSTHGMLIQPSFFRAESFPKKPSGCHRGTVVRSARWVTRRHPMGRGACFCQKEAVFFWIIGTSVCVYIYIYD